MTEYLWMGLCAFALMFFVTISINSLTARFLKKFPDSKPVSFISGCVLILASLITSLLYPNSLALCLKLALFFLILCFVQLTILKTSGVKKELYLFFLSLLSVLMLPTEMNIFQMVNSYLAYLLLGAALYLVIRVFVIMDKVPNLSLVTIFSQGILFFFVARSGFFGLNLSHPIFYLMLSSITIAQLMKLVTGSCVLGKYAASITGFILGYLSIYLMAKGFVFVPLMLFSYDIFEILFAGVLTLITTHHFYPKSSPYLIEKALATGCAPQKLTRYLFLMQVGIIFSVYVIITQKTLTLAASVLVLFILVAMYIRLKNWGKPRASFKDLKSDLKQGFLELKEQIAFIPLKDTPVKKEPSIRKRKGSKK